MLWMWLLTALIALVDSCKPAIQSTKLRPEPETIIRRELGDEASVRRNSSGSFAICTRNGQDQTQFMVVRLSDNRIVVSKKVVNGFAEWTGDLEITYYTVPGIIREGETAANYMKKIDLRPYLQNQRP